MEQKASEDENGKKTAANVPKSKDSTSIYYQARKRLQSHSNGKTDTLYLVS